MGQDFSKEYSSTWEDSDVLKWIQTARDALKIYYLAYEGIQWHEYSVEQRSLLTIKICFALYGPPTIENANYDTLEKAYSATQKEAADKIKDKIIEVYNKSPATSLQVGILFISCKQQQNEFLLPVFRVYTGDDNNNVQLSKYIDTNCRVYKDWSDWKKNNKLPMMKYCYPLEGFYTCSNDNTYRFESDQDPAVHFGTSPACGFLPRVARQADVLSGVTSLGSGGIAIAAMFTPLAPVVLVGSAIAGTTAAFYGAGRSINRLIDKGTHDESLTDLESLTCWLSILITPAHVATTVANGALAAGARNSGRIFSSTARTAATILNLTTFGLDSVMVAFGFANLIEKAKNDQLTPLDVLQFSMSIFFFGHTLIQPKTASRIIKAAQNEHITAFKNAMSDLDAQKTFQDFVDQNRGNRGIRDNSKIVRTINKIENPNGFFKGLGDMKADIGGRKGRTIIINDNHGQSHRVNPNRVFFDGQSKSLIDLNALRNKLSACFRTEPESVQINGEHIFQNMTEHQMQRVETVLGGTARKYNNGIVETAKILTQKMGYSTVDDFLCVVELVAKEVQGKYEENLVPALNHLQGAGQADFISGVQSDLAKARQIAQNANISFANDLKAVYHYRKHGNDFPTRLSDKIDFYLSDMPHKIFKDANLTNISRQPNGATIKTYITSKGEFGVVVELPNNQRCIVTLFKHAKALKAFQKKMAASKSEAFQPSMVGDMAKLMASSIGFASVLINVTVNNKPAVSLDKFTTDECDEIHLREIARILHALTLDDDDHRSSE
ncbi:unnamed protein product [Adineta steineri]|uniref:DUF4781 domain-containing protein n=1 Tax=Adineta steineri TaxID=433720 RepID=A0A814LQQ1_9BILA|nr:unnamed protein product [Adineta steineri]CAF1121623.1 unnamed protein product [Adineta steineri]